MRFSQKDSPFRPQEVRTLCTPPPPTPQSCKKFGQAISPTSRPFSALDHRGKFVPLGGSIVLVVNIGPLAYRGPFPKGSRFFSNRKKFFFRGRSAAILAVVTSKVETNVLYHLEQTRPFYLVPPLQKVEF